MALTETQQIYETIERSRRVLICFGHDSRHDGAASALALQAVLRKLDKEATVAAADWRCPAELRFLTGAENIAPHIENLQRLIIEIDLEKAEHNDIQQELADGKLRIALSPKRGVWRQKDVSVRTDAYSYDLICTIGAPDLESLGKLFENHTDFFYHTPIINIDHDPSNEHYGQINCIDITCAACGEVLFELCAKLGRHLVDEQVATHLLTGMISKTQSFKSRNVTPKTLQTAGELVAMGARREEIVNNLYRRHNVPALRLWGRALARLKHSPDHKLVWTLLSRQDFLHAGTGADMLAGVIDEIIINAPEAQCALILYENQNAAGQNGASGILHAKLPLKAAELAKPFGGVGVETIKFELPDKTLMEAEPYAVETIKKQLGKITNWN